MGVLSLGEAPLWAQRRLSSSEFCRWGSEAAGLMGATQTIGTEHVRGIEQCSLLTCM